MGAGHPRDAPGRRRRARDPTDRDPTERHPTERHPTDRDPTDRDLTDRDLTDRGEGALVQHGYIDDVRAAFADYDVLGAFWVNIQLTFFAAIIALVLGTILAVMRISPVPSLQWAGGTYVTLLRNTPLTIIIVGCVLGLWGQLGLTLGEGFEQNFFRLAVVGLAVYHAAFVCEALRSGVNTVPNGQAEAARAVGLTFGQTATLVILPQAFRGAVAPLGNVLIALIKNSTVAAAGSVAEASVLMREMIENQPDVIVTIFLVFALGFVAIVVPVGLATTSLSRRWAVAR